MIIYLLYGLKFKVTIHPNTNRKYKVTALYNIHTIQREQMLMSLCDDGDANVGTKRGYAQTHANT